MSQAKKDFVMHVKVTGFVALLDRPEWAALLELLSLCIMATR
jgi:hypothetical protein